MSDPVMLDMQQLCMNRVYTNPTIPKADIRNPESGRDWIHRLIAPIFEDVDPKSDEICVSNQRVPGTDPSRFFMVVLTPDSFKITESRSTCRSNYQMNFSPYQLLYDGRRVDRSFESQILEKMRLVAQSLTERRAVLSVRKKQGGGL